jgi:hypothetical protein
MEEAFPGIGIFCQCARMMDMDQVAGAGMDRVVNTENRVFVFAAGMCGELP